MFCGEVDSVKNTKILVAKVYPCKIVQTDDKLGRPRSFKQPTGNPLQFVIYSNQISLSRNPIDEKGHPNTAMILPFPILPSVKNRFKIFPFERYATVFDDVEMLFPEISAKQPTSPELALPVMNIGSYSVSIAKDIETLSKINPDTFNVSRDMISMLKQYYPKNFGFVICLLKTNAQYHPLGYVHELRQDGKLFIPTRHCHVQDKNSKYSMNQFSNYHQWHEGQDGEIDLGSAKSKFGDVHNTAIELEDHFHDTLLQEDKWMRYQIRKRDTDVRTKQATLDWDHQIYIVNHVPKIKRIEMPIQDRMVNVYSFLSMNLMPTEITFGGVRSLVRITYTPKDLGNNDLYV
jgi:hypothetical protein